MFGHLFDTIMVALMGGGWPHTGSNGPGLSHGRDILLNSWIGHITLIVPLAT